MQHKRGEEGDVLSHLFVSEDEELLAGLDGPEDVEDEEGTQDTEGAQRRLSCLARISRAINSVLTIDQVLDLIMDELIDHTGAERGFIMLADEKSHALECRVARMFDRARPDEAEWHVSRSVADRVFTTHEAILCFNAAQDPRYREAPSIREFGLRAILCVPLRARDHVIGIVYLDNHLKRGAFTQQDLEFCTAFSDQASLAIENARLEMDRRQLRSLFEGYVGSQLLEEILSLGGSCLGLEGRRCVATVMFCDIRGFTSLSEVLDAVELVARLNEFYREMGEIIFDHGGILFTYMGDAIMAVFGAPTSHGDDAVRAVKTALDMCRRMEQLTAQWKAQGKPTFQMGIGLCTGEVIAGNVGFSLKREYTVIGDTVNTASRLEKLNKELGSRIVMSDSTRRAVESGIPVEPLGNVGLRGKAESLEVWSVPGFGARSRAQARG